MTDYWFNNIFVLFQNMNEFFPKKEFNRIQKVNSIARFAIYYSILICLFKLDTKYLSLSFCLILLSYYLGYVDTFESITTEKCTKPTNDNPYMNFTIGDQIINPNRPPACDINLIKNNDRNFYTMPSTTLVNDQEGFANFLYGDFGKCKSEGKDCLKNRDNRFHRGRYYYQY